MDEIESIESNRRDKKTKWKYHKINSSQLNLFQRNWRFLHYITFVLHNLFLTSKRRDNRTVSLNLRSKKVLNFILEKNWIFNTLSRFNQTCIVEVSWKITFLRSNFDFRGIDTETSEMASSKKILQGKFIVDNDNNFCFCGINIGICFANCWSLSRGCYFD